MAKESKRKRPKKEDKQMEERWKIENKVFDKISLESLYSIINQGIFCTLDFPIAMGKEAAVFRGTKENGEFVAVKIYRISANTFTHMRDYIIGDERFEGIKKDRKQVVLVWARKEFKNLTKMHEAGVHVPKPVYFKNTVLVMDFIGEEGNPAATLKAAGPTDAEKEFGQLIEDMKKMYSIKLVHSDLSEFNILKTPEELIIIDVGQAVDLNHPKAEEFLARDVRNILSYYSKFNIHETEENMLKKIKGK